MGLDTGSPPVDTVGTGINIGKSLENGRRRVTCSSTNKRTRNPRSRSSVKRSRSCQEADTRPG